ncbi:hypothetical protein [Photorhabdus caribbeanensis]|uniref:hypothetical protein n=1 Tax=Photorhabdus caribbeanensis TaxID=1004165 RepID=UPI001BD49ED6|nr:hypothetical protein [Photorhabdus caribbeanensis]MBS9422865.1 hypothetical protein [Photorhabdus caribbeanensis]
MPEKKGFFSRLFGKQEESACCAVRIKEVPDEPAKPAATKSSSCCAVRIEAVEEEDDTQRVKPSASSSQAG